MPIAAFAGTTSLHLVVYLVKINIKLKALLKVLAHYVAFSVSKKKSPLASLATSVTFSEFNLAHFTP